MSTTTLSPFNPDSYPIRPNVGKAPGGEYVRLGITQAHVETALQDLQLEAAKNNIHHVYGGESRRLQQELLRVIDKIVELNLSPLSAEHQKANYTLDAGYSLACHIYTRAGNDRISQPEYQYLYAIEALQAVADAYAKKGDQRAVIHTLSRLQPAFSETEVQKKYIEPTLARFKTV